MFVLIRHSYRAHLNWVMRFNGLQRMSISAPYASRLRERAQLTCDRPYPKHRSLSQTMTALTNLLFRISTSNTLISCEAGIFLNV